MVGPCQLNAKTLLPGPMYSLTTVPDESVVWLTV
jgi:hypothetical protein